MKKATSFYSKILASLLALLGFSTAFTSCMKYGMPVKYGMPNADFEVGGTITSAETAEPIEDIKIVITSGVNGRIDNGREIKLLSNSDGQFYANWDDFPPDTLYFDIQDIDGENNGEFNDTIIKVPVSRSEYEGGGEWYDGVYRKHFDFQLTSKK